MKKNVALLGASHIHTRGFVDVLAARTDVSVAAVWDPDPAIADKYAAKFGCRAAPDAASVLGMPDLDAVIVLSQTNRHEELVRQIASAGKHCFVEKPLGMGLADARNMMRALEGAGVIFHMGYFNRTIPAHRLLRRLIAEQAFGAVSRMRLVFGTPAAINGAFRSDWEWMADPKQAGVGAFGDLGTHKLDLLLHLIGTPPGWRRSPPASRGPSGATRRAKSAARRSCASTTAPSPRWRRAGWTWWSRHRC